MVDRFKLSAGNTKFNIKQARHPTPLLGKCVPSIRVVGIVVDADSL